MNIKLKITLSTVAVTVFCVLVSSIVIGTISSNIASKEFRERAQAQLVSTRNSKQKQIESYFGGIGHQISSLSESTMVVEAMEGLSDAFTETPFGSSRVWKQELSGYYQSQFQPQYNELNPDKKIDATKLLADLSPEAAYWQLQYIQNNPNPLGSKHLMNQADLASNYDALHKVYHPRFTRFLENFEYYDVFLVDAKSGHIVYSVFKELDFGTSLFSGPYSNSGIAQSFKAALDLRDVHGTALTDFAPYSPSYEAQASFVSSPIQGSSGDVIGVLIFQMPIARLNYIMTNGEQWRQTGLGETGQSYLVGSDKRVRTVNRALIEDKQGFLAALKSNGVSDSVVREISLRDTNIGLQSIDTIGVRKALAGETGFDIFRNYKDISVLSAYTPLSIVGVDWVLLTEISEDEAFAGASYLVKEISVATIMVIAGVAVLCVILGGWVASSLSKPIIHLNEVIKITERDSDFSQRADIQSRDELGTISTAFNGMLGKFSKLIHNISDVTNTVASSSQELTAKSNMNAQNVEGQSKELEQFASAMYQMNTTVQDVARNTSEAADAAKQATQYADDGKAIVHQVTDAVQALSERVAHASDVAQSLESEGESIGAITDVIKSIAEQTNLLALNAAIEAARAGEQGRGFAVVADEVRTLAQKTQQSTHEIEETVERLRSGTTGAVKAMDDSQKYASNTLKLAVSASDSLESIVSSSNSISDYNIQIANASEQQLATVDDMNRRITNINELANQTAESSNESASASGDLSLLASNLKQTISQFKV